MLLVKFDLNKPILSANIHNEINLKINEFTGVIFWYIPTYTDYGNKYLFIYLFFHSFLSKDL